MVQNEFLAVGAVKVLVRLMCLSPDPEVRGSAVLASVALLFGGNDDIQREYFKEFKVLKDANFYKTMFDRVEAMAAYKVESKKEVRVLRIRCCDRRLRPQFGAAWSCTVGTAWSCTVGTATPLWEYAVFCCNQGKGDTVRTGAASLVGRNDDITIELKLLQLLCEGHVLKRQVGAAEYARCNVDSRVCLSPW